MHVAEKPSTATLIAKALAGSQEMVQRGRSPPVFEFGGRFRQHEDCNIRVTSVCGHVFSTDFPATYQNWDEADEMELFRAPVLSSAESKSIVRHLEKEAVDCDYLILWLDCDREGENICFEVIRCVQDCMKSAVWRAQTGSDEKQQTIFRAHFSALTTKDICVAMQNLVSPNENESRAVEARQELDLRVGVAFSRFQTKYFQGRYIGLDSCVISYGPCQTPTLGFIVDRHDEILSFVAEEYFTLEVGIDPGLGFASLILEWQRGRIFDKGTAEMFLAILQGDTAVECIDVREKEGRMLRPVPLNTVQLLKLASKNLGIGPHTAMRAAESLYLSGCLSYPRTESTAYPQSFDAGEGLRTVRSHPDLGSYAAELLAGGWATPRAGVDCFDHPPLMPVGEIGGGMNADAHRIYNLVVRHFLASLSPDATFITRHLTFVARASGEVFFASQKIEIDAGFLKIYRMHRSTGNDDDGEEEGKQDSSLPSSITAPGGAYRISSLKLRESWTTAPAFMTESELIGCMERHKIGTDASIPSHINNVIERKYCTLGRNRTLVPSTLGVVLVHGYRRIDAELCKPDVRSAIEHFCNMIARGEASKTDVLEHSLKIFEAKFQHLVSNISKMESLFEASFSPHGQGGKALSKCGKCLRYMLYIEAIPKRLYCSTCEEIYNLPQNGTIKLYKELRCPLDGFELLLFSLGNKDNAMGKSFPICPSCYNNPPDFGGDAVPQKSSVQKMWGCNGCAHPTCRHGATVNGMLECPGISDDNVACEGNLILDVNSKPYWCLSCNMVNCKILLRFHGDIHSITPLRAPCAQCGLRSMATFEFNKIRTPLKDGETALTGCLVCNDVLNSISEISQGRTKNLVLLRQERQQRGGRGRGGRGRSSRVVRDPKMLFAEF